MKAQPAGPDTASGEMAAPSWPLRQTGRPLNMNTGHALLFPQVVSQADIPQGNYQIFMELSKFLRYNVNVGFSVGDNDELKDEMQSIEEDQRFRFYTAYDTYSMSK